MWRLFRGSAKLALLFLLIRTAWAKTIYLSDARPGQGQTFDLLERLLKLRNKESQVVRLAPDARGPDLTKIKRGDTLLVNVYSRNEDLLKSLKKLESEGVRVLIELEFTADYHVNNNWAKMPFWTQFPVVTGSRAVAEKLKKEFTQVKEVHVLPHLESLYLGLPVSKAEGMLTHARARQEDRRLLLIHQNNVAGMDFINQFFDHLDNNPIPNLQVIVAAHPSSSSTDIEVLKEVFPDVQILQSGRELKTNRLVPIVDAIVSHSSTLMDVARDSGVPVFDSSFGSDFRGLEGFLDRLDPAERSNRRMGYIEHANQAIREWENLLLRKESSNHFLSPGPGSQETGHESLCASDGIRRALIRLISGRGSNTTQLSPDLTTHTAKLRSDHLQ